MVYRGAFTRHSWGFDSLSGYLILGYFLLRRKDTPLILGLRFFCNELVSVRFRVGGFEDFKFGVYRPMVGNQF